MQALGAMITSAQKFLRERPRQTLRGLTNIHLWNRGKIKKAPFITNSTSQNKK